MRESFLIYENSVLPPRHLESYGRTPENFDQKRILDFLDGEWDCTISTEGNKVYTLRENPLQSLRMTVGPKIFALELNEELLVELNKVQQIWCQGRGYLQEQKGVAFITKKSFLDGLVRSDYVFIAKDLTKAAVMFGNHTNNMRNVVHLDLLNPAEPA